MEKSLSLIGKEMKIVIGHHLPILTSMGYGILANHLMMIWEWMVWDLMMRVTTVLMKVREMVGYLPENVGFYSDMNAVQSLEYIADLNGIPGDVASDKIWEVLKEVGLTDSAEKKVGAYSRGMRQRLGIAEVLIKDPKVLFLDEPTLGLDPDGALRLIDLVQSLNRDRKITVLLSSHNLHQVQKISHRVGIMIRAKMVAIGSIEDLAEEKFGVGEEEYTLEEIYMKYFQEV